MQLIPKPASVFVATREGRVKKLTAPHPMLRALSMVLVALMIFSSSPALMAMTAMQAFGGASPEAGGKGGSANLLNAGAASATQTANNAKLALQQSQKALSAIQHMQARASSISQQIAASAAVMHGSGRGLVPYSAESLTTGIVPTGWKGVSSVSAAPQNVTLTQNQPNAYLTWKSFDIPNGTTVNFNQKGNSGSPGTWIAFNQVLGMYPSDIFGRIVSAGQVYILNQNGILFHNGSQVNVHTLVASTLPINGNLAGTAVAPGSGIANNKDQQFLFSALPVTSVSMNPFTPVISAVDGTIGNVIVEPQATITSPPDASHSGGMVLLAAPEVQNHGTISTKDGQTILAAGLQVGIMPHNSGDPSLRGKDVYIGRVSDPSVSTLTKAPGTVQNDGIISIPEGNLTMAGKTINQSGVIDSATSTGLNGRVDLLALYNAMMNPEFGTSGAAVIYDTTMPNSGTVTLAEGSVISILPDANDQTTVTGTSLALKSLVSIEGNSIRMTKGSLILAPGATATAGALSQVLSLNGGTPNSDLTDGVSMLAGTIEISGGTPSFSTVSGSIVMDSSAEIDVAGSTGVNVQSSQNYLTLQLRGNELANSPIQRINTAIRGRTITIDARIAGTSSGQILQFSSAADAYAAYLAGQVSWIGTPLGDATGFSNLIQRSVSQLTEAGGSVKLIAGESLRMSQGSTIDVSGGWSHYSGGNFTTSKVLYQGHLLDISAASPDQVYSGLYSSGATVEKSTKWGITKTFVSPLDPTLVHHEAAYDSGAPGGSLFLQAPHLDTVGTLLGNTSAGARQLRSGSMAGSLPLSSSLTIKLQGTDPATGYPTALPSSVVFSRGGDSRGGLALSPDLLSKDGFGYFMLSDHDGVVSVTPGTVLDAGPQGSISIEAANIDVQGSIIAPNGSISLQADLIPYALANNIPNIAEKPITDVLENRDHSQVVFQYGVDQYIDSAGNIGNLAGGGWHHLNSGIVTLGDAGTVSTAGLMVDDTRFSPDRGAIPLAFNGGTQHQFIDGIDVTTLAAGISISGYQVNLDRGGLLNVSGGVYASPSSVSYGNASTLSISAGRADNSTPIHNGSLQLDATLLGYAGPGAQSGALSLSTPPIVIGNAAAPVFISPDRVVHFSPSFFNQGGFSSFYLEGLASEAPGASSDYTQVNSFIPGIDIAAGTHLQPEVSSWIETRGIAGLGLTPESLGFPFAPASSISLKASGLSWGPLGSGGNSDPFLIRGSLVMESGSSIQVDPQLTDSKNILTSKGGVISLKGDTVSVKGDLMAPGGSITLKSTTYPSHDPSPAAAAVTLYVAPGSILSTAGESLATEIPVAGHGSVRNSSVLAGGNISLSGNILLDHGVVLDASGASAINEFYPYQLGMAPSQSGGLDSGMIPYRVDSAGGTIVLNGSQALYSDAMMVAQSGGPTAAGGTLSISSGRFYNKANSETATPIDMTLAVNESGGGVPKGWNVAGATAIGSTFLSYGGIPEAGGHVSVDSWSGGGFDNITLGGNVRFNGKVELNAPGTIAVATGGILQADSEVDIKATRVALGTPFLTPGDVRLSTAFQDATGNKFYLPPTHGDGKLNVTAQVIDLGNLSLQGIGNANFKAPGGLIRGDGTVDIAGNLRLTAAFVYPVSGVPFALDAYNYSADPNSPETLGQATVATPSDGLVAGGSITILQSGKLPSPLSALGGLSIQADTIIQSGTVVAPFGSIVMGSGGGNIPDAVSGMDVVATTSLKLSKGSVTSISGVDSLTGEAISVPFGVSSDGTSWTSPSGDALTSSGLNAKYVSLTALNLSTERGSLIDLMGGGGVTANQFISGQGGTIDYLSQPNAYAIVPGYQAPFAPTGYSSSSLDGSLLGMKVVLSGGAGLPAGTYTLLPGSYATQPGAFLLLPSKFSSGTLGLQPDGSVLVAGTLFNGLDFAVSPSRIAQAYELDSPSVLASKVNYQVLNADTFFAANSSSAKTANGGNLVIQGISSLKLNGGVKGQGMNGGTGSSIDINSSQAIMVTADGIDGSLSAAELNSWSVGSLLLGGFRGNQVNGLTPVTVNAPSITIADGTSLSGNDIILVAQEGIVIGTPGGSGATVTASVSGVAPQENLQIGAVASGSLPAVSGDGVFLRVSSDPNITLTRKNVDGQSVQSAGLTDGNGNTYTPSLTINGSTLLQGGALLLDSTSKSTISQTSSLNSKVSTINAGAVSLILDPNFNVNGGTLLPSDTTSLQLSGTTLSGLQNSSRLSISSYSSIDLYGNGNAASFGSANLELSLHAGEISSGDNSAFTITANTLLLDNVGAVSDPSFGAPQITGGALTLKGNILKLGSTVTAANKSDLSLGGFQTVAADFSGGVVGSGNGTFLTAGDLSIQTPLMTGEDFAQTTLSSLGSFTASQSGSVLVRPGLGASLSLTGGSVNIAAPIVLPSGTVSITASGLGGSGSDLTLSSKISVAGISKQLQHGSENTGGGVISLSSKLGNLDLAESSLDVSAPAGGGSAGRLSLSAPNGALSSEPASLSATAPKGTPGSFTADLGTIDGGNLASLESILSPAGFIASQNIRDRSDVTITIPADETIRVYNFTLSADAGSIDVYGKIDASDVPGADALGNAIQTGGSIALFAGGNMILETGATLDASAQNYNNAGNGGAIILQAGSSSSAATIDLQSGSSINLSVAASPSLGKANGILTLVAPQNADATGIQINPIQTTITGASSIIAEGVYKQDAATPGLANISYGNWDYFTAYRPSEQVLYNGVLYQLSISPADTTSYQAYLADVCGGNTTTPDSSPYWTVSSIAPWDGTLSYAKGDKVFFNGVTYTSQEDYSNPGDGSALSPDSSPLWKIGADDGNYQQLALNNAMSFTAGVNKSFAGSYAVQVIPREEIVNTRGGLVLGNTWDLSLARYGNNASILDSSGHPTGGTIGTDPGFLGLRALGDVILHGSLSDGFGDSVSSQSTASGLQGSSLLPLLSLNGATLSQKAWSYGITAGADFSAANPLTFANSPTGSVFLGNVSSDPKQNEYSVLRTGAGNINIAASADIQLRGNLTAIYSAGALVPDQLMGGTFDLPSTAYPAQFSSGGGDVSLAAGRDIAHVSYARDASGVFLMDPSNAHNPTALQTIQDSVAELPSNWLYRRGGYDSSSGLFQTVRNSTEVASTAWWVDFSNFFEDVGALGGGNVSLAAGRDVSNMDAVIPTSFRMPGHASGSSSPFAPDSSASVELGGGDLSVVAGQNINAGVYYVENGNGLLSAGGSIITNPSRDPQFPTITGQPVSDPNNSLLPTTLFLGKGSFSVNAQASILLGPVENVFLTPPGINNGTGYKSYFSTYASTDKVSVMSLSGDILLREAVASPANQTPVPLLQAWMESFLNNGDTTILSYYQPWIALAETGADQLASFGPLLSFLPPNLSVNAVSGSISLQGNLTVSPAPLGNISLVAAGSINGFAGAGYFDSYQKAPIFVSSTINLSDADPNSIPGILSPVSNSSDGETDVRAIDSHLQETGSYFGPQSLFQFKQDLHGSTLLHAGDSSPLVLSALGGDISGLTLFSPKQVDLFAGGFINDAGLYIQNVNPSDISIISAVKGINGYNINSPLRSYALSLTIDPNTGKYNSSLLANAYAGFPSGDIQISGPGTLEILSGGAMDLGHDPYGNPDGDPTIWNGVTSIGNARNPALSYQGANIVMAAGISGMLPLDSGLAGSLALESFTHSILSGSDGAKYLSELTSSMTYSGASDSAHLSAESFAPESTVLSAEEKSLLELRLFFLVLRDAGRNYNKPDSKGYRSYSSGEKAVASLLRVAAGKGDVTTWARNIETYQGGDLLMLAPGGGITLVPPTISVPLNAPGIITAYGGSVDIFAKGDVNLGNGRIFTLRGGDIMIWSDQGNIAAGNAAKTVASAPPAQVLIDPQSGDVKTDLSGLATGGGIGVLATVEGVPPGNVDLIAPSGIIDAGDAGIRSSGNLNLAATKILNADNIAATGSTAGAPPAAPPAAAPNLSAAAAASSTSAANNSAAQNASQNNNQNAVDETPSIISIDILGYGGGDGEGESADASDGGHPQASL